MASRRVFKLPDWRSPTTKDKTPTITSEDASTALGSLGTLPAWMKCQMTGAPKHKARSMKIAEKIP